MKKPYIVENIKNTSEIIDAALEGYTEFSLKTDDANIVLKKYNLNTDDEGLKELLRTGTLEDWFKAANTKKNKLYKNITKFLYDYVTRIENLKNQNKNLFVETIRLITKNPDLTVEDTFNYKFP